MNHQGLEAERERILAIVDQERSAVETGDSAAYLATLCDDAIFMPPNGLPKSGAELRSWLSGFVDAFQVEWLSFSTTEVVVEGSMAYHAYTYRWRVTPRAGGPETLSSGKGVHILRRQQDESWRIAREIWNASPESPQ